MVKNADKDGKLSEREASLKRSMLLEVYVTEMMLVMREEWRTFPFELVQVSLTRRTK